MSTFSYKLKTIPTKGRIVYEYNPLYNLRLSSNRTVGSNTIKTNSIYDLDTNNLDGLNFDLNHPVDIDCQNSYDGSVNLIINDGKNAPKLINTRFAVHENNTYEIIDREGTNVTNIYDENLFESDSSLYKKINKIPQIELYNVSESGSFKVGNYVFYITYSDADENETDIVAESGIVSCFVGANGSPQQINGGYKDWNSNKAITFKISNIDRQYDYIRFYYSRASSDIDLNVYTTAYKIVTKYPINSNTNYITITGNEETEEISLATLNTLYFLASSVKTQALCKNRLFFGNVTKVTPENKELKDLSLHIYPSYNTYNATDKIGKINYNYMDTSTTAEHKYAYYDARNIYNFVGYWPEEIYRFGIVYILKDGSLSPVYNVLGMNSMLLTYTEAPSFNLYTDSTKTTRFYLPVDESDYSVNGNLAYNAKGVIKFPNFSTSITNNTIISIQFNIPRDVITELKKYSKGFFFVRQKRIPTILCQGITLATDVEADVPIIPTGGGVIESFINSSKILTQSRSGRLVNATASTQLCACICPDYDTNEAFLNLIFTGAKFYIKKIGNVGINTTNNARLLDMTTTSYLTNPELYSNIVVAAVQDSAPVIATDIYKFRARCGEEGAAYKFRYIGSETKKNSAINLVRGLYGPYLGIGHAIAPGSLINIYIQGYDEALVYTHYYKERYEDNSLYYTISNRYIYSSTPDNVTSVECFRGDSYIATTTHRLNRNFQDPSAPLNDIIIEPKTWSNNYDINDLTKCLKINRGDVNAIKLGTWFTTTVRSTRNLGLRSVDLSYPSEQGMFGHPRGFYPYIGITADGEGKLQESGAFNAGFLVSVGERWNFVAPSVPYTKNVFLTRIAYSDIAVNDAIKNGYRIFKGTNYRDYTYDYGSITKIIEFADNLVCVFEHGVALIPVTERTLLSGSTGGDIFINTSNVLPETPLILSSVYGSQWKESIIKTQHFIYGVDTVARKIWRTDGKQLACISDFTVLSFLNENISLGEFEFTPIIGIRNVKTHYNMFKLDVMFTFYDNTKGENEVAWNLCFNELTDKFVTFYSWLPSFSENIHNIFFTFDRDTSKIFTLLAKSKTNANEADGITVSDFDINNWTDTNKPYLSLANRSIPEHVGNYEVTYTYSLVKDRLQNESKFSIQTNSTGSYLCKNSNVTFTEGLLVSLILQCEVKLVNTDNNQSTTYNTYTNTILLVNNLNKIEVTNWFWKHGLAGLFDCAETIKPTKWYGVTHPFEFECIVVADSPSQLKIFNNLKLLSNKTAPESFHFEIVGEGYDWSNDKETMYYRQEATKCLFLQLGSNITYDYKYLENAVNTPTQLTKSTIFPLTYYRNDKLDEILDTYVFGEDAINSWKNWTFTNGNSRDYEHLSGSEITHNDLTNEYRVWMHQKGIDIKKNGRMRGNMNYVEDSWEIQINSIIFALKNETAWNNKVPPIAIVGALPSDISTVNVSDDTFTNTDISTYTVNSIDTTTWGNRKETKIRDKYIKIRVRYNGEDLAIINGLITIFNKSYA